MRPTLTILAWGVVLLAAPAAAWADDPRENTPALVELKPLAADPKDDELHKLLKERFNAALREIQAQYKRTLAGMVGVEALFDAGGRLKHSGLEALDDRKDKVALLEKYVELAKAVEGITAARYEAGQAGRDEVERAHYFRLDAEIALLRLNKQGDKPK